MRARSAWTLDFRDGDHFDGMSGGNLPKFPELIRLISMIAWPAALITCLM